jgi:hypothetical protein
MARLDRAWHEGGKYPCNDDRTTYIDLRAAFIVASWHTEDADPLPKEQTSPSANDGARSRGAAGQIDSLGIGLELGRPGIPNALRVSSACFQDLGCTRNQPVVALPCFDSWRLSSFTSRARRSQGSSLRSGLPSATDGALIERRHEEFQVQSRRWSCHSIRGSRDLPPSEPFPPTRASQQWKSTP